MLNFQDLIEKSRTDENYRELREFVKSEQRKYTVYPNKEDIFNAYNLTPLENVKVVILGQDPYHEPNQAHGLSFSVKEGVVLPPSLKNILKAIELDDGLSTSEKSDSISSGNGDLTRLATQGVLLVNNVLTVRKGVAFSHRGHGWEQFTEEAFKLLDTVDAPIVFMLWGKPQQEYRKYIKNPNRLILTAPHPSPLSAHLGFFECKHFSKCNNYLKQNGLTPIIW